MNRKTVAGWLANVDVVYRLPCRSKNAGIALFEPLLEGVANAPTVLGAATAAANPTSAMTAQRTDLEFIDVILLLPSLIRELRVCHGYYANSGLDVSLKCVKSNDMNCTHTRG